MLYADSATAFVGFGDVNNGVSCCTALPYVWLNCVNRLAADLAQIGHARLLHAAAVTWQLNGHHLAAQRGRVEWVCVKGGGGQLWGVWG